MILILGGTSEASALARLIAGEPGIAAVLSLAGRTESPALPPIPYRVGGFGGVEGLAAYIEAHGILFVVDATHPFAARISRNAEAACRQTGTPLLGLRRPPWRAVAGDDWTEVADAKEAAAALGDRPRRVFLTTGRLELPAFLAAPQHHYVVRSVDPPDALPPDARLILARGPFREEDEARLIDEERIDVVVTKNSGGEATYGKIAAARARRLPVILLKRPDAPDVATAGTAEDAFAWIKARR